MFAAALVTSIAVTWISTRSIESFLREQIDEKYPDILRSTSERLDLWYSQRQLEIETFARSATVVENLVQRTGNQSGHSHARKELAEYLSYVIEAFPQYEALLVLNARGQILARVGPELELSDSRLRHLGGMRHSQVGDVERIGERTVQVASAPFLVEAVGAAARAGGEEDRPPGVLGLEQALGLLELVAGLLQLLGAPVDRPGRAPYRDPRGGASQGVSTFGKGP